MFKEEAIWIANYIYTADPHEVFPLLNVGSSTEDFRARVQPWIDTDVFAPARRAGLPVTHMDIKDAPGVDVVGDLEDISFSSQLKEMNFHSVLCSNLLEHVTNKEEICVAIENMVRTGGHIIVTCPHKYPYHPDPIDTLFRPTPYELAALFRNSTMVRSVILDCGSYADTLIKSPKALAWNFLRLCLPCYKHDFWRQLFGFQFWMFSVFKVSCVVLKRNPEHGDVT